MLWRIFRLIEAAGMRRKDTNMANQDTATNQPKKEQSYGVARANRYDPLRLFLTPGSLLRMNPFSLMTKMTEEMVRVFGEIASNRGNGGGETMWAPAIEVSERDGKYVIHAELAGVKPEAVKLEVTEDGIVLEGEREVQREEDKGGIHLTEREYGHFYRSIPLPEGANIEQARAKFENGVLEITVPVPEQKNKPRQIPIETTTAASSTTGKAA
jgi:HSP20 family protein